MQRERPWGEGALIQLQSGRKNMCKALILAAVSSVSLATPTLASQVVIKPIIESRVRYETVDQTGTVGDADALTVRLRAGATIKKSDFTVLIEGEGTLAIIEDYNSGVNGKIGAVIPDPETIELNRAQVQYAGIAKTLITAGRQRINLDDQRFVGSVGWRQNEQTFDAVRVEYSGIKNVKADVTYAWSQRTIWGVDGFGGRQQAVNGDNIFVNLGYKAKTFGITGFAYLVDMDEAAVQAFRFSSKTFGARANATLPLGNAKLNLLASYATQSDYNRNPNNSSSDYILAEAMMDVKGFKLTAGYEVLGADNGVALSSFQAPLGTLHKFNGWADKFLITPPNGLRDLYFGIGYAPKVKALPGLNAVVTWHQYESDRLSLNYGTEWNAQLSVKVNKRITFLTKYADYNRKGVADFAGDADTKKFWAQFDYTF